MKLDRPRLGRNDRKLIDTPSREMHRALWVGLRSQVCDDVLALGYIGNGDPHLLSGNEFLGIGQPFFQRLVRPDDGRRLECGGVGKVGDGAGFASEQPAMRGAGTVIFDRMAGRAALPIGIFAFGRIAGGDGRYRACGKQAEQR